MYTMVTHVIIYNMIYIYIHTCFSQTHRPLFEPASCTTMMTFIHTGKNQWPMPLQSFFDFTICMSSNMLRKKHLFALLFAESLHMFAKYVFNEVIGSQIYVLIYIYICATYVYYIVYILCIYMYMYNMARAC